MNQLNAPVAIVGGRFAGLTAAQTLKKQGILFTLYEAGKQIAGLAQTFKDEEGISNNIGTHSITNRLAVELDIESQCRYVSYFGEAVLVYGQCYSDPVGQMKVLRDTFGAIRDRLSQPQPPYGSIGNLFDALHLL